jgi:integrase
MAQTPGIRYRHSRTCEDPERCGEKCGGSWEASVFSKRDGKKIRQTFSGPGAKAAAKQWRSDATRAVRLKKLRAPTRKTVREAAEEFLRGAEAGEVRTRKRGGSGGTPYKPAVVRQYRSTLEKRFLPEFGDWRLSDLESTDLLAFKERLYGEGISDSTVRNVFVPVQAIFRRAKRMGDVAVNPAEDLDLPSGSAARDRAATPRQAAALLEALPEDDRALWATAFYAGLRRGELRALRAVDVNETVLHVEYGWDDVAGQQGPKSLAGRRDVPLTETLRGYLRAHLERTGRSGEDLVFGRTASQPFTPGHVSDRADEAWAVAAIGAFLQGERGSLERFTLHEGRHSFSTWLDAAGVSEERADRYMGHSRGSVASRYRHPQQYVEDAKRLDEYLGGSTAGKVVSLEAVAG